MTTARTTTARLTAYTPEGERVVLHVAPTLSGAYWSVWVESGCLGDGEDRRDFCSFADAVAFAANEATNVAAGA